MPLIPTPTAERGATTTSAPMTYVAPTREATVDGTMPTDELSGMNVPLMLDKLSEILAHERCGAHLYRSVGARTHNPMLKAKYEDFGRETERHVELATHLIAAMGGDPMYVSPAARATEGIDTKLVESTYMLAGSVDMMTAEMVMLTAVLIAESVDHANWQAMKAIIEALPDGSVRTHAADIITEIAEDEDEHLAWARDMRQRMTLVEASSSTMAGAALRVEETVARIKSWFT